MYIYIYIDINIYVYVYVFIYIYLYVYVHVTIVKRDTLCQCSFGLSPLRLLKLAVDHRQTH